MWRLPDLAVGEVDEIDAEVVQHPERGGESPVAPTLGELDFDHVLHLTARDADTKICGKQGAER